MEPKKHRRRWLQYGIRTLLVLMLVVAVFFAWVRYQKKVYVDQRQALEQITQLGGHYKTERRSPAWLAWLVGADYVTVSELRFRGVRRASLDIDYVKLKPVDLEGLQRIPTLRQLHLDAARGIDNSVLDYLKQATELEELNLDHGAITDVGISKLLHLRNLRSLSLLGTNVPPLSAARLSALPNLERLNVSGSGKSLGQVTFCNFPKLQELTLGCNAPLVESLDSMEAEAVVVKDNPKLQFLELRIAVKSTHVCGLPSLRKFWQVPGGDELVIDDLPVLEELICTGMHTSLRLHCVACMKKVVAWDCRFVESSDDAFEAVENTSLLGCDLNGIEHCNWPSLKQLQIGQLAPAGALQRILTAPNLRTIYVQLRTETIAELPTCQSLEELTLAKMPLTGEHLALVASLPGLRSLTLGYIDTIRGDELAHLKNCRQLTSLELCDFDKLSDDAVPHLLALPETLHLELSGQFLSLSDSAKAKLEARPNTVIREY